ncbi:hypothetical protein GWK47_035552 [Chionoecetes opilio]|uniref:Isopenicillin N synthase-like Fe(2+) 2OG dioxygenase domain-containing protein n=1 Tax=Chionoecetes opilio TaxID=41210 RepID=A0A8J4YI19_CHIOP|nr:hypothetical protein GWK47_035552 [Chionoecetes opilio]
MNSLPGGRCLTTEAVLEHWFCQSLFRVETLLLNAKPDGEEGHDVKLTRRFVIAATLCHPQICDPSGQWVDVPFVPGTILLLAGEFLHFYSNKRFIPVMHKVVVPSENHPGYRPRCSLIYFEHADNDTPMWPPGDDPDSPAPPSVKEHIEKLFLKARAEGAKYTSP